MQYKVSRIKFGKQLLKFGLPIVILLAVFFFLSKNLGADWKNLFSSHFQLNPWLLVASFLGFILQELSYGLIWRAVLNRLGFRLHLLICLRIYLASEFVRYIPGNVWHVLTRILWTGKYGVPRPVAFASMTVELITKLAAGAFVFALSLLFWGDIGAVSALVRSTPVYAALGLVSMIVLLLVLHPRILNGLLNFALRLLKRDPVVLTLCYRDILLVMLAWCVSWIIAGCAFFVLILAFWPTTPLAALPICIGIYALVWDIGFVSFLPPGGLGVREAALFFLFQLALPFLPVELAAMIAILSRLVSTGAELLCVGLAYLGGGKQMRAVQWEQAAQSSSIQTAQDEGEAPIPEISSSDRLERGVVSD